MSKKLARLTWRFRSSERMSKKRRVRPFVARRADRSFRQVLLSAFTFGIVLGCLCLYLV